MAAALLRTVPRAGGFSGETEQPGPRHNLIQLTEVIEQNVRFGLSRQTGVRAQIAQDAIADPPVRDPAELLLDGL